MQHYQFGGRGAAGHTWGAGAADMQWVIQLGHRITEDALGLPYRLLQDAELLIQQLLLQALLLTELQDRKRRRGHTAGALSIPTEHKQRTQPCTFSCSLPCSSQISLEALSASWLSCSSFSWTRLCTESSSHSFSLTDRLSCSFSACRVSSWALSSVPACQWGQKPPSPTNHHPMVTQSELRTRSAAGTDGLHPPAGTPAAQHWAQWVCAPSCSKYLLSVAERALGLVQLILPCLQLLPQLLHLHALVLQLQPITHPRLSRSEPQTWFAGSSGSHSWDCHHPPPVGSMLARGLTFSSASRLTCST